MSEENLLKSWNLGLLVFDKRDLVHVPPCTTVEEALFVLQRENILAVAVYEENVEKMRILTIFDVLSYVAFGSFKYGEEEPDAFSVFRSATIPVSDLLQHPIHAEDEKIWSFNATDAISAVLEPMSKGVHRVLVDLNNGEGKPQYRMLTQTDVLRFLSSYSLFEKNSSFDAKDKIKNLSIISHSGTLKSLNENTTALEVFRTMQMDDVLAVPLVDKDGKLSATLSSSDLRGLRSYQLKTVLLPAIEYLLTFRGPAARRCVTCTEDDSLLDVITKLVIHRVHRVWVVDNAFRPVGVISISDIIGKFVVY